MPGRGPGCRQLTIAALAGIALLVIATAPSLAEQAELLIPVVCGGARFAAMPFSYLAAHRIAGARPT
jgi:hypothetical protein